MTPALAGPTTPVGPPHEGPDWPTAAVVVAFVLLIAVLGAVLGGGR